MESQGGAAAGDSEQGGGGSELEPTVVAAGAAPVAPFVHPGVLLNREMLERVKARIDAGEQPWTRALAQAKASVWGDLGYVAQPREVVSCGSYSNPDIGCSDEKRDVVAAYTHALLWVYTGERAHAEKAIEIMEAWGSVLKDHTLSNAPLQAAWVAEVYPRAAEIIRYTYDGWSAERAARFGAFLREVYLPEFENGHAGAGNWEASMIEALLNIAVYTDDHASFERALAMWRRRTPAYIYSPKDGPTPVPPPHGKSSASALVKFWHGQRDMMPGLSQETCRDIHHTQYGLAGIINAAETAFIQGVDLYAEEAERLRDGLEFHARLLNGAAPPDNLCGGALTRNLPDPMWEIALNHFGNRRGEDLPATRALVMTIRPTQTDHHMCWETLTHADVGAPSAR